MFKAICFGRSSVAVPFSGALCILGGWIGWNLCLKTHPVKAVNFPSMPIFYGIYGVELVANALMASCLLNIVSRENSGGVPLLWVCTSIASASEAMLVEEQEANGSGSPDTH
jgi:hypothetical protein